jgi:hypothetical protein
MERGLLLQPCRLDDLGRRAVSGYGLESRMHVTTNVVEDASRRNANHRQATAAPLDSRSSLRGCATLAWACIVEDVVCQARPSESAAAGNSCDLVGHGDDDDGDANLETGEDSASSPAVWRAPQQPVPGTEIG